MHLTGPARDGDREVELEDVFNDNYSIGVAPEPIEMFEGEFLDIILVNCIEQQLYFEIIATCNTFGLGNVLLRLCSIGLVFSYSRLI